MSKKIREQLNRIEDKIDLLLNESEQNRTGDQPNPDHEEK